MKTYRDFVEFSDEDYVTIDQLLSDAIAVSDNKEDTDLFRSIQDKIERLFDYHESVILEQQRILHKNHCIGCNDGTVEDSGDCPDCDG